MTDATPFALTPSLSPQRVREIAASFDLRALPATTQFFVAEQGVEAQFRGALAHLLA